MPKSPQRKGPGPVGATFFNWLDLSDPARKKLGQSQLITIGETGDALTNLVESAKNTDSILAICGYKEDYATEYYKQNFLRCRFVKRVFSYEAMYSEIDEKCERSGLDGLILHRDTQETTGCDVEVIVIPKGKRIKDLAGGNFDPPLSFGLTIRLDEKDSPSTAVVHWEMGAKPLKDLMDIEGVIIDAGQDELLNKLVRLHKRIASSNLVLSSQDDPTSAIGAYCEELVEFWKSRCPQKVKP